MGAEDDLLELKRRVTDRLLALEGVSGVGIRRGTLTVYLVRDDDWIRRSVHNVIEDEAPGVPFNTFVTGMFKKQS
jgi:hypothetical protein